MSSSAATLKPSNSANVSSKSFVWEKNYPGGKGWNVVIPVTTICEQFEASVHKNTTSCAIEYQNLRLSYAELGRLVLATAAGFVELGVKPKQAVALYLPNTPYHPVAFLGALKAGARIVHLSPLDSERTLRHKLADSGARVLVTSATDKMVTMARRLLEAGLLDRVILADDACLADPEYHTELPEDQTEIMPFSVLLKVPAPTSWPQILPDDIALLQYTGGTTGMPKGTILTHGNLTAAIGMYDAWFEAHGGATPGSDRVIGVLPLFHIYALTTVLLRYLKNGDTILLHQRFDVEAVLHDIEVKRATQFPGVPTMWIAIANHAGIENRDFSSLVQCNSGGAPLPIEIAARFKQLTGLNLRGGWGMTETAPAGTRIPPDCDHKPGTIGIPMPGVELGIVSLIDPTSTLGIGEVGELRCKGANVTAGYWNCPDETSAAFADGYLLTGDIGYMDEDGYFFIVDRKKDMILSGGFNVYPQMIEQAIYEHPSVNEVLVMGAPDAYRGEVAKAFIALRPGHEAFSLEELRQFLKDRLGPHELPDHIEFRAALPRTPVGKLSKLELKTQNTKSAIYTD